MIPDCVLWTSGSSSEQFGEVEIQNGVTGERDQLTLWELKEEDQKTKVAINTSRYVAFGYKYIEYT